MSQIQDTQDITYVLVTGDIYYEKFKAKNHSHARDKAVDMLRDQFGTDINGIPQAVYIEDERLYAIPTKSLHDYLNWSLGTIHPDTDMDQYEIDIGVTTIEPEDYIWEEEEVNI